MHNLQRKIKKINKEVNLNGLLIKMTKISKHCLRTCQDEEVKNKEKKCTMALQRNQFL